VIKDSFLVLVGFVLEESWSGTVAVMATEDVLDLWEVMEVEGVLTLPLGAKAWTWKLTLRVRDASSSVRRIVAGVWF